ncbi:PREDICTED: meiotic recombination protein SPO11-1 isoform X2 [Tarenaya hassleriana]|uniref:meiotic recombination protein SPO11-1 isoform X2 n=1 Tax=Tarenaya hassleriana TaxID=28532 RepID=UPI00053C88F9|nr:PREDICTED: meiotic recombination protein SPO11-1 isoform X2 [Tarenaya hassleriana]
MAGKVSNWDAAKLLQRIKDFTRSIIEDLARGRSPTISINRFRNYCMNPEANCFCSSDEPKGQEILTITRETHTYRIDILLRVLLIIRQLLQENRHGSKRDIYYMHPSVFTAQSVVDRAINDICILFQCSRHNLNVNFIFCRMVMGWLRFKEAERKFDCINNPNTAFPIPVLVEEVKDIVSIAEYILVVEKETVFQRLANDTFCKTNRCIVITGRGYPDVSTRRFLRLLMEKLHLPVYCLVDCDPYGFEILATYRFGSKQMAYDIECLRAPGIQWLGAFPSDSEKHNIPKQCLLPLTEEDKKRTEALLLRCYLKREMPQWRLELEVMLQRGVKFEIEALSVHSLSYLSEVYIPSKIRVPGYLLRFRFLTQRKPLEKEKKNTPKRCRISLAFSVASSPPPPTGATSPPPPPRPLNP